MVLLAVLAGTPPNDSGLECRMARAAKPPGAHVLEFTLTNRGREPVAVLDWSTPLEGLLADVLVIRRDGGPPLSYTGPSIKRGDHLLPSSSGRVRAAHRDPGDPA